MSDPKTPMLSKSQAAAARLVSAIIQRRTADLQSRVKRKPRASLYASQIGDCERQAVYEVLEWKKKDLHAWQLEALFEAGKESELAMKAQLSGLGRSDYPRWEIVETESPVTNDLPEKYGVHGFIDAKALWERFRIPLEFKLAAQHIFDRIEGIDLFNPEVITPAKIGDGVESLRAISPWTRKYLRQGTVYMLGHNMDVMIFAFTNGRGAWKFVIYPLDMNEAAAVFAFAKSVKKHVRKKKLPARIQYDPAICRPCPFRKLCLPNLEEASDEYL